MKTTIVLIIAGLSLAACASGQVESSEFQTQALNVPGMSVATQAGIGAQDYLIGPLDKINVRVFGQTDLSVDKIQVDASGQIVLPLIGAVTAGGKTAGDLSKEIAARLSEKYFQAPSVSVFIDEAVSQRVTVTGAVIEEGIYPLKGPTTLNQAVSMAKGPDDKVADLKRVAIFRTIEGRSARAVFDLSAIRSGKAPDPVIFGGDTIVVADSKAQRVWRELIGVLPGIGVFAYF